MELLNGLFSVLVTVTALNVESQARLPSCYIAPIATRGARSFLEVHP